MKGMIFVCLVAMVAVVYARPGEQYTDKYDNINVDEILTNDPLRDNYHKCMMDKGKCTPEGKELKSHIQEALEDGCAKCSEKQMETVKKVIKYLCNHKVDQWEELKAKYDPENKYSKKYEDELKELKKD